MSWFDGLLKPIMVVVGWIMYGAHWVVDVIGLDGHVGYDGYVDAKGDPVTSGLAWVLSIIALVLVMRIIMIPLFVKQINAQRGLQLMQPEMQKIQKKYKDKKDPASRQKMQEEMQALYKKAGTNPLSSCWPILLQSPFFFALFRVLNSLSLIWNNGQSGGAAAIGPINQQVAGSFELSNLFGAPLSSTFMNAAASPAPVATRIVTVVLIVLMSVTTFTTQRQLTMKNMPSQEGNPMASQQKMMLYAMPLIFAFSGINFPIGVLIYWLTTNLWSMGQQFFVIRKRPAPGSEAERKMKERARRKAERRGEVYEEHVEVLGEARGQRVQPKRKDRQRPSDRPAAPRVVVESTAVEVTPSTGDGAKGTAQSGSGSGGGPGGKGPGGSSSAGGTKQRPASGGQRSQPVGKKSGGSKKGGKKRR